MSKVKYFPLFCFYDFYVENDGFVFCYRKVLLEYFDSKYGNTSHIQREKCCDNCSRGFQALNEKYANIDSNGFYDFTESAYLLLKGVQITGKLATAILVVRGSNAKEALQYQNSGIYGFGEIRRTEYWQTLVRQLKFDGYFTIKQLQAPFHPLIILTDLYPLKRLAENRTQKPFAAKTNC